MATRDVRITDAQKVKFRDGYWAKNKGRLPTARSRGIKPIDAQRFDDVIAKSVLASLVTRCTDAYDDASVKGWPEAALKSHQELMAKVGTGCYSEIYRMLGTVRVYCNAKDGKESLISAIQTGWREDDDAFAAAMLLKLVVGVADPIKEAGF